MGHNVDIYAGNDFMRDGTADAFVDGPLPHHD